MRRARSAIVAMTLVALTAAATGHAKGATSGEIAGPGLDGPVVLSGSWNELGRIADVSGFYAAAFGREPNPLRPDPPKSDLGPRYTITYTMPGPDGRTDELRQDVYPYASPAPVAYIESGQPFFENMETRGGWVVAMPALREYLVEAGLPRSAPVDEEDTRSALPVVGLAIGVASFLVACALAALLLRRRPQLA